LVTSPALEAIAWTRIGSEKLASKVKDSGPGTDDLLVFITRGLHR